MSPALELRGAGRQHSDPQRALSAGEGKALAGGERVLTPFSRSVRMLPSRAGLPTRDPPLFAGNKAPQMLWATLPSPVKEHKQEPRKQDYKDLAGDNLRRKTFLLGWRLPLGWHKAPEQTAAYQKRADRHQWLLLAILVVFSKHKIMHKNKFSPGFSSELPLLKITYFSPPTVHDRWLIFTEYFTT